MDEARELERLRDEIGECTKCPLCRSRTRVVFGSGDGSADLLFVGEAPGRAEDAQGLPFVGPAGKLLDRLLSGIGMKRQDVYITNVVKCRPPGNRDPSQEEMDACNPFLRSQIDIIRPKVLCALGRVAASLMLERTVQISKLHGERFAGGGYYVVPVFHPAAALRTPSTVRLIEDDFKRLKVYLEDEEPPPPPPTPEPEQMGLF